MEGKKGKITGDRIRRKYRKKETNKGIEEREAEGKKRGKDENVRKKREKGIKRERNKLKRKPNSSAKTENKICMRFRNKDFYTTKE